MKRSIEISLERACQLLGQGSHISGKGEENVYLEDAHGNTFFTKEFSINGFKEWSEENL